MLFSLASLPRATSLLLLGTLCLHAPNGATALPTSPHHHSLDLTNPHALLEKLLAVETYVETHIFTVPTNTIPSATVPQQAIQVQKRHHETDSSSTPTAATDATNPQATDSSDDKKKDNGKKHGHRHCKKPENKDKPECKNKKNKDEKDGGAKKDDGKGDGK